MKKYLFIFKSEVMSALQYSSNLLVGFIGYFIIMFIFLNLWKYIYSDPSEVINGYTMSQMIWYVTVTEILWSVVGGRKLCTKISSDVKEGNIAYNINKPYNYIGYCLSGHLGDCSIKAVVYILLGGALGFIFLGSFPDISILQFILVLIAGIFATVINTLLIVFIGLFSFIIEDANPFYWLYSKLILVVGTLFPIEYFPKALQGVLKFSPIYVVSYGPARLFVNFSWKECISIFLAQGIYLVIAYSICALIYRKGVKRLNVNGG